MTGVFTIDPRTMSVKDWTDAMAINIERFGPVPVLRSDDDWRNWGAAVSLNSSLGGIVVPSPYEFENWEDWAQRFNESLSAKT